MSYVNSTYDQNRYQEEISSKNKKTLKVIALASSIPLSSGEPLAFLPDLNVSPEQFTCVVEYFDTYIKNNFSSVEMYNHSNLSVIRVNSTEAIEFANGFQEHMGVMAKDLQVTPNEAAQLFWNQLANKKVLIKPVGFSSFLHNCQLTIQSAGSGCYTAYACASSAASGTTGVAVLASTPLIIVTVPTLFGLGFATTERVFYGTPIGNFSAVAKSVCFVPMWGCEHILNHVVSPLATAFGLDIAFNLTSSIQNGIGLRIENTQSVLNAAKNPKFWTGVRDWFSKYPK